MAVARPKAEEAAVKFIDQYFPFCQCALLAGSIVRGEATDRSDLDLVIFDDRIASAYRESFVENGWPIEAFVHNFSSYKEFFKNDCRRGRPSLPMMVAEGVVVKGDARLKAIKSEAVHLLKKGPDPWTEETVQVKRYFLTDMLDDFIGSSDKHESLFIAGALAEAASEFVLRVNGNWIGHSKWILRALRNFNPDFASNFASSFENFYHRGEKEDIVELVDKILQPYGGRLFESFSLGKTEALKKEKGEDIR